LREVVALALEGEDLAELGFAPSPVIVVTFELEPAVALAEASQTRSATMWYSYRERTLLPCRGGFLRLC